MQKLAPVFDSDTRNAFKFAEIVCDDDQSAATGMASNHLVIRPDRCSLAGQFGTDLTGMYRCLKGHVGFDDQTKKKLRIKSYDDLHIYHHQRSYYSTCNQPLAFFCIHHNHFR